MDALAPAALALSITFDAGEHAQLSFLVWKLVLEVFTAAVQHMALSLQAGRCMLCRCSITQQIRACMHSS
jgi:hypothetical protein